jgi:drug/metabolite transporter (DMT)-like permease
VLLVFTVYLILSAVFHWLWPSQPRTWSAWLIVPVASIGILFTIGEVSLARYSAAVLLAMVSAVLLGRWLRYRAAKTQLGHNPPRKLILVARFARAPRIFFETSRPSG